MKIDVVLGLQWGDEGKGKIVDVLAGRYPAVARFQGGPNAGHSLQFEGKSFVVRSVPSGIFREGSTNIIGNGVVLDPVTFREECNNISRMGITPKDKIIISKKAHLILPTHKLLDAANEAAAGKGKIGSTLKGIGPTYTDKISRHGLRVGDILAPDFKDRFEKLKQRHIRQISDLNFDCDPEKGEQEWMEAIEFLKSFRLEDCEYFVNNWLEAKPMLAEGAQGSLLDVDYGSYPFVTSSSTTIGGVCTGLGVPPSRVGHVFGIFKAYCTRVGSGPFPTELFDETGEKIRQVGHEFGAVTGRPRRTGWLDLVALKYTAMLNGVTDLVMMKSDCLDDFETVKVCTGYKINGEVTDRVPFDTQAEIEPIYTEFKGWNTDLTGIREEKDLPAAFKDYIKFMEEFIGIPVKVISLGPDRNATIER
ncbi:MAG: adenylosuccinate synthase [Bacteroidales bacterium]|jgi:adenylosuccinate synthase|nr:adenylosuccinate synthase [Bacteroidales bacterium]MCI1785574.1 adenylosuccinate synthase [Bacteroidales bacterium]